MTFSEKQIGVLLALIFGLGMLILPNYQRASPLYTKDLSLEIWKGKDLLSPSTLKKWIDSGKRDYLLVDIRSSQEFERGHIQGAENIPLVEFSQRESIKNLPRDLPIILYSSGEARSAQAWVFLRSMDLKVYYLGGGYLAWQKIQQGGGWTREIPKNSSSVLTGTKNTPGNAREKAPKKGPNFRPKRETEEEGC